MSLRQKQKQRRSIRKIRGGAINAGIHSATSVRMAVGTLNQWAMDFKGNAKRIIKSIKDAHDQGAVILALPELAVSGYSCQDHFYEREMFELSFLQLLAIAETTKTKNILVCVGCPILHKEVRYNCSVFIYNGKIVLIRPKHNLADDGNYREARWFTAWTKTGEEEFNYMKTTCPIGISLLNLDGIIVGAEVCEELWVPDNLGAHMYLAGADVLINGSGSHFELGKQENKRKKLLENATRACGGIYLYSNLKGCDGERLYFDGGSLIAMNGRVVGETPTFTLDDVQLHYHDFIMNDVTANRMRSNSYQLKASHQVIKEFNVILITNKNDIKVLTTTVLKLTSTNSGICSNQRSYTNERPDVDALITAESMTEENPPKIYTKKVSQEEEEYRIRMEKTIPIANVEEVVNAAACWLWDYLRRSGTTGYMLPLSGGADSAATACIVYRMCQIIVENKDSNSVEEFCVEKNYFDNNELKVKSLETTRESWTVEQWCGYILNSVYLPTKFSGTTRDYAAAFANDIGASHEVVNIDAIFRSSIRQVTRINFEIIENDMKIKRGLIALKKRVSTNDVAKSNAAEELQTEDNHKLISDITDLINKTNELISSKPLDESYVYDKLQTQIAPEAPITSTITAEIRKEHADIVEKDTKILSKLTEDYQKLLKNISDQTKLLTYIVTKISLSQWDLAVQNVQARTRMVMTYTVSQLKGRALLNLGSSNADEVYVGYYTKYDASSADVNPIGSLPKTYIQRILIVFGSKIEAIRAIVNSEPTAELTPVHKDTTAELTSAHKDTTDANKKTGLANIAQTDETDIGLLYTEMSELGRLMSNGYGPIDTYQKLMSDPGEVFAKNPTKEYINEKITLFNYRYRFHRHKAVILPPSVHLLSQTPDDNRYNLRPFLYPPFTNSWHPTTENKHSLEKNIIDKLSNPDVYTNTTPPTIMEHSTSTPTTTSLLDKIVNTKFGQALTNLVHSRQ
jgi:NAD+ synthetase